jgi:hypothetical protein
MQIYSGLHLSEEVVFASPLPLWERDRVRGNEEKASLFIQTKVAIWMVNRVD